MSKQSHRIRDLKQKMTPNKIERLSTEGYWIVVPREPATFGHLLVVSWKGLREDQDITDKGLFEDEVHMKEIMKVIHKLAFTMKEQLQYQGKRCERVYVATLCETSKFPFHFHLIPRFEGDRQGFAYLFEKELEEARWMFDCDESCGEHCKTLFEGKCPEKYDKIVGSSGRIVDAECVLERNKDEICSNKWARSNEERRQFIQLIKVEIERILAKCFSH